MPASTAAKCLRALNRPRPRVELAPFLRQFASAAIDISDGLLGDLRHLLEAGGAGAEIDRAAIPVDAWIQQYSAWNYALEAGDDYEICCTVAEGNRAQIAAWNRDHADCPLTAIGQIVESGYRLRADGEIIDLGRKQGYRHFA